MTGAPKRSSEEACFLNIMTQLVMERLGFISVPRIPPAWAIALVLAEVLNFEVGGFVQ
jgi:hypothetical protein